MTIHTPWSADLGASRAQMEVAAELRNRGHEVEKFSLEDAFPDATSGRSRLRTILASNRSFARRAVAHVRRNGGRFDVIEANQTDLPVSKAALGFDGLLVVRSLGSITTYEAFERRAARRWPQPRTWRDRIRSVLTWPGRRRRTRDTERSLRHADLILVSNRDEEAELRERGPDFAAKVRRVHLGLPADRRRALAEHAAPAAERMARRTVAFVGAWSPRKGSMDWPELADRVLARVPDARFRLLGTGFDVDTVRSCFSPAAAPAVEVVPHFDHPRLPELLSDATIGAFPGYLEGFGLGSLEMLAAGLPTVGYEAPGSRETLGATAAPSLLPAGDVAALADRLADLLELSPEAYRQRAEDARATAEGFRWEDLAERTEEIYRQGLAALGRSVGSEKTS